jgi:hypothetical protein
LRTCGYRPTILLITLAWLQPRSWKNSRVRPTSYTHVGDTLAKPSAAAAACVAASSSYEKGDHPAVQPPAAPTAPPRLLLLLLLLHVVLLTKSCGHSCITLMGARTHQGRKGRGPVKEEERKTDANRAWREGGREGGREG